MDFAVRFRAGAPLKNFNCLNCNTPSIVKSLTNKGIYCGNVCQMEYQYKQNVSNWLNGSLVGWKGKTKQIKNFVRKYLYDNRGTACEQCGWDIRHPDGSILTEIDHIDGNAENCNPDNLRVLCPNCHSLTPTFRNRNKNSTRER